MDINSRAELETWNLQWTGELPSRLSTDGVRATLGTRTNDFGIYFIGEMSDQTGFEMHYVGKSSKSLHRRLLQHVRSSSNSTIRAKLAAGAPLWFHFLRFNSQQLMNLAEGVFIVALFTGADGNDGLKFTGWNRRNEWKQHWAAEDD
jgi:hypothetical protein